MSASRLSLSMLAIALLPAPLVAQKEHRQPLTPAQVDQIREDGIYADDRIHLYTKFINEHVDSIKGLGERGRSSGRTRRLDDELQDLTALMDELGSNLDQYGDRKADIRKSLKGLNDATPHWLQVLNDLHPEPGFDLSRKEAIDSGKDLADQASQLLKDQSAYFDLHKDQRGQERAEPQ